MLSKQRLSRKKQCVVSRFDTGVAFLFQVSRGMELGLLGITRDLCFLVLCNCFVMQINWVEKTGF